MGLKRNLKKEFYGFLSKAGNSTLDSRWIGCNRFDYLGHCVYGQGSCSLSKSRLRRFIRSIEKRVAVVCASLKNESVDYQGQVLCDVLNTVLLNDKISQEVLMYTDDQGQLKQLDYLIAKQVAQTLSKIKGVRSFRIIPYKKIRTQWGLLSLVQLQTQAFKAL